MCFGMEHRQQGLHGSEVIVLRAGFTNSVDIGPVFANYVHAEEGWRTDGRDFFLQEHRISEDLTPVGLHCSIAVTGVLMTTIH